MVARFQIDGYRWVREVLKVNCQHFLISDSLYKTNKALKKCWCLHATENQLAFSQNYALFRIYLRHIVIVQLVVAEGHINIQGQVLSVQDGKFKRKNEACDGFLMQMMRPNQA